MTEDQQDIAWKCLPKETRAFIREQFEATSEYADFDEGYDQALMDIFGLGNITSEKEPSELLFVERKKVQGVFDMHERAENKVAVRAIQALFGDKEPSVQSEPKFKVGDKVYCKNIRRVLIVRRIITESQKYELYDEHGYGCGFWEWNDPNLEPHTKPETKDDMEEKSYPPYLDRPKKIVPTKELNLCELLKGCEGETFFHPHYGDVELVDTNDGIRLKPNKGGVIIIPSTGCYPTGMAYLYPDAESLKKYPLDAYSAWMEWKSERTSKRWRAKQGETYWYISRDLTQYKCTADVNSDFDRTNYENGNMFRTEEEAQQAAEALKECLMKFHEQKPAVKIINY